MNTHKPTLPDRLPAETLLLAIFLVCRAAYLWLTLGQEVGFDTGAHLEMVRALSWLSPDLPLGQYFYAYHPPLGFLLAKCFTWVGFSPLMSVQLLNAAASLGTFFILRATLGRCGLLARPAAVFFLYFGASLPIQLFLASSINLDVLTAGCAALTLYLSVRLCWDETLDRQARLTFATAIAVVIAASMLIKFSGLLLVTIPVLTALAHPKTSFRLVSVAGAAALVGLLLVSPYYVSRYYQQTGRFFPTNLEIFAQSEIAAARAARDSDRLSFFLNMVAPSPVHGSANTVLRDRDTMRLADVWQDVWLQEANLGPMTNHARALGYLEKTIASILCLAGAGWFLLKARAADAFDRLGIVWFAFGSLQLAAFIFYLYSQPVTGWAPTKGIYLAASLPLVAFVIARLIPFGRGRGQNMVQTAALGLVAILIVLHHLLPVR